MMAKDEVELHVHHHSLRKKLAGLALTAVSAFAGAIGTNAAEWMKTAPPPTVVIVEEEQMTPSEPTPPKVIDFSQGGGGDVPHEHFRVTITGEKGLKHEVFIQATPQQVAAAQLAPADHPVAPVNPYVTVKSDLWGAPSGFQFLADKEHMLNLLSQHQPTLSNQAADALKSITEIHIEQTHPPTGTQNK
jgi:hypothetical protein